ncbi:hypothetical protein K466DRAFT_263408, partial [Polyporus arcularius HHB13444]
ILGEEEAPDRAPPPTSCLTPPAFNQHLRLTLTVVWHERGTWSPREPLLQAPQGPCALVASGDIKARYFDGKNASAAPVLFTILAIFGRGYTIDYQSASSLSCCWRWMYAGIDERAVFVVDDGISAPQAPQEPRSLNVECPQRWMVVVDGGACVWRRNRIHSPPQQNSSAS